MNEGLEDEHFAATTHGTPPPLSGEPVEPALPPISRATNSLWVPPQSLAGCVRAVLSRNTVGADLSVAQRHNHFPAVPLCSLNWRFTGRGMWLDDLKPVHQGGSGRWLPQVQMSGPLTRPRLTWDEGPSDHMIVLFMPDALHSLTGVPAHALINRAVDAQEVLPDDWLQMIDAVRGAQGNEARRRLLVEFLEPRWSAARPSGIESASRRFHDWAAHLLFRAANSSAGRSVRQIERRVKCWAGLPMRELRLIARAERAFFEAVSNQLEQGSVDWADMAASHGYADQSHFCREVRRLTGFSPEELRRRIAYDETFWTYRLWN